jgi:cell wall-associated NlpC family hydrolase
MGMYIGNGKMVHAPQTGDVVKIAPIAGRPFAGGVRLA